MADILFIRPSDDKLSATLRDFGAHVLIDLGSTEHISLEVRVRLRVTFEDAALLRSRIREGVRGLISFQREGVRAPNWTDEAGIEWTTKHFRFNEDSRRWELLDDLDDPEEPPSRIVGDR